MARKGARVPTVYAAKNGKLYVLHNDQVFVLYRWVAGRDLNLNKASDLKLALRGLAAFHRDSAGYLPPVGCRVSSKLGRWPHHYTSMLARLQSWKQEAAKSPGQALSKAFLAGVDSSYKTGHKALLLLEKSYYGDWVKRVESQKTLCHQDFGEGNVLAAADGIYVLDLDSVTYDLPARDLRKIVVKQMGARGKWDRELLRYIVNSYAEINPLTEQQLQVLYIDLMFPHEFHDTAKNPYRKNKPIDAGKLVKAAGLEQSKIKILESMLR